MFVLLRRPHLANEYVSCGGGRLGGCRTHGALHEPRELRDDGLHDAEVVQHRDGTAEEDDHRKYLHTESEC